MWIGTSDMAKRVFRILYVEDNPADVFLVRTILETLTWEVQLESVRDGEDGLNFLRRKGCYGGQKARLGALGPKQLPPEGGRLMCD